MSDDFSTYIEREREELSNRRRQFLQDRKLIDYSIAAIDREFAAIDAYERTKTGRPNPVQAATNRARRGSRRAEILQALDAAPGGMSRGELLERLGVKGDKSGEMSVSNALTGMIKGGRIRRDGKRYHLPAARLAAAAE